MTVYVIAGHGAGDSGACAHGRAEAELVRILALRMKELGGDAVELGDLSRNYYADGGVSSLGIPAGWPVVELHMDSAGAGARGGHVIIKEGFEPDAWDRALAEFVAGFSPGRAEAIVGRSDLANVNRAAAAGYNYRLLECCFISDRGDLSRFEAEMDAFAAGVLRALGAEAEVNGVEPHEVWEYSYGGDDNCYNALHLASREVLRRDDPTGRGQELTVHEHVKWIAAKQEEMRLRQEAIEGKVDAMLAAFEVEAPLDVA